MTIKEAVKLTHKERLASANPADETRLRKVNMSVADREMLGALFHEHASARGTATHPAWANATIYELQTQVGLLTLHYDAISGAIFGRFAYAAEAANVLGSMSVNCFSGKWNTHTDQTDNPATVFASWKRQLERVLS
jgi:hypothetical protein